MSAQAKGGAAGSDRVVLKCEYGTAAFGHEATAGQVLVVPAADAEKLTAFWVQVGGSIVHPFRAATAGEVAAYEIEQAGGAKAPPTPAAQLEEELKALTLEQLYQRAKKHGIAYRGKPVADVIAAVLAKEAPASEPPAPGGGAAGTPAGNSGDSTAAAGSTPSTTENGGATTDPAGAGPAAT